jgi:1,5-anhydro-D-fructose reductase (1,5-anhydro-D-mannitol-forming)
MMTIGWGVIGIGIHANRFVGPAINRAADTSFVSVCSRSLDRAKDFASKHGVKRCYDSYEKMLEDPEVDVIYIATPNNLHRQNTVQAARAGKHVLCEKPMALSEEDCNVMIEACEKNSVKLGVDFQNRYHPAHVEVRRLIQNGTIGEIKVARAQYSHGFLQGHWGGRWRDDPGTAGAGALMATALHPIDLLRFVMDSEIVEVQAVCATQTPYHTVDEMVYAILKFQNGVYGTVISGILAPRSDNDLVLYGSRAKVTGKGTVGMPLQGELLVEGESINVRMDFPTPDPIPANFIYVIEAFNRSIKENTETDISGFNGLQMVRIASAILESSRGGKAVQVQYQKI